MRPHTLALPQGVLTRQVNDSATLELPMPTALIVDGTRAGSTARTEVAPIIEALLALDA